MKGATEQAKVHYKGEQTGEDYIVFVDDVEAFKTFKKAQSDKSVSKPALVDVVQAFKIFVTHKHGAQGTYDEASNGVKESDFGTKNDDAVIEKILLSGELQESKFPERQGPKNDSQGAMVAH